MSVPPGNQRGGMSQGSVDLRGHAAFAVPQAAAPLRAAVRVPGSKSLTNRHVALAALFPGRTTLHHPLRADDCDRLVEAVAALGADAERSAGELPGGEAAETLSIAGAAGRFPRGGAVDLGDGGTPARFMLALGACAAEPVTVDGSPRLRERPMAEGLAMLRRLGAEIECLGAEDHLPVRISAPPGGLRGGRIEIGATRSSQFASALMLIAPALDGGLELRLTRPVTSAAYLRLSASALRDWGASVEERLDDDPPVIRVAPSPVFADGAIGSAIAPPTRQIDIEADASSAVYWMVAAALIPGSCVELPGLPAQSQQPDLALLDVLEAAGADVHRAEGDRPLRVAFRAAPRGFTADASDWPDGALAACALAACAEGPSRITGLHTLVHKESDRLAAMRTEFAKLGVRAETTEDSIAIFPAGHLAGMHQRPVEIETWNDHRIAMTFAVIGLVRGGVHILDPGCVNKSYPGFWTDLNRLVAAPARPSPAVEGPA